MPAPDFGFAPDDGPTLIAHRGFAGENPENTVAAMEAAARTDSSRSGTRSRRADAVEIDVQPTADGDVVVFHDDRLGGATTTGGFVDPDAGLTDATGVVWETDTAAVTDAEVLDSGETVPRLCDVLDAVPSDVGVNVELKNPGRGDLRPGEKLTEAALAERTAAWRPFVERVLSVTGEHDHAFLFSSFCEGALAAVSETSDRPVAPIGWESVDDVLAVARQHEAAAVHPPVAMIRGSPFFDAERFGDDDLLAAAHDAGRDVNVWTVATWHQAARLEAAGVDGVIADYSTVLRR
ncbi:glycerophosphodiester phosphodiesterase [Halorubrum sp. DTA46]|uniref:glycerophosphodiester phosphodiesterase n=1 Tax=Halorubrum sp. DTA46 TaxID=3402162 RepID=UPI003AAD7F20